MSTDCPWFKKEIIQSPTREFDIDAVKHVQRVLHCEETGKMDEPTRQAIRGLQLLFGMTITGTINLSVAQEVDRLIPVGAW